MRTRTVVGYALFAALLAGLAPAPAEAQLGKFLKKKLKEAVVQTAVDAAAPDASGDVASAGAPRARKGTPGREGPVFSEDLLEITPELIARLQLGLVAEAAQRLALAGKNKNALSREEYGRCKQDIMMSPEGNRISQDYVNAMKNATGDRLQAAREAMNTVQARLKELANARCGPDPSEAGIVRQADYEKILNAGVLAFGRGERPYAMLKERVQPLCTAAVQAKSWDSVADLAKKSGWVYASGELDALRLTCATLLPLFRS